ncbi:efflux RND transporter permease subunit [Sedimenticola selenatireducens]|uniref:Efflux RND transporter permease subunit n=1 Tax=Sedimenticola selenatireducens TaxID=191960 RepID=A0A557SGU7_9GAMM|nr:efflux RND transporter permease subunit [Sedimenticola selenatireducens]TVO76623.1 efflux RND transporter permease subunit [Sedimenticola selenatireducens]TVT64066.1 MAG: efflux RND transporter permease subunit [Sedimenticola selenatireducens]
MLGRFFNNHVLANLTFGLVLVVGFLSYNLMPREQDPSINFNWIDITTVLPGAAAADVEKRVTEVLEKKIRTLSDIKFVSSTSRESISSILVRFEDIPPEVFDKRVADLRREVQNADDELPDNATTPFVFEITTANAFPSATLAIVGPADDENLRRQAENVKKDIERIKGVDRILDTALRDPELQINFYPERLENAGVSPSQLADTVARTFQDLAAGSARVNDQNWLVRIIGQDSNPEYLAALPVLGATGEVPLGDLAQVVRAREKQDKVVFYQNQPAVMLAITKKESANTLELVQQIADYVETRNQFTDKTGVRVVLIDDQTEITRNALNIMQTNALLGLIMVLFVTWLFLGTRISLLTTIGIPFILAGTFLVLNSIDQTLNVSVLLGVVISLGMLVDDAVVVVESIYYRLQRGMATLPATLEALREVVAPVTTAVLTTMAAFLPLMLLPGILGKFMLIIPLVVTIALAISLIEAYWMLPAHILGANISFKNPSRMQRWRTNALHWVRVKYTLMLVRALRWPKSILLSVLLMFIGAFIATGNGLVKIDFFATDPIRLFYVSLEMPAGTPLEVTRDKVLQVEEKIRNKILPGETRNILSYAGQLFTETAPFFGDHYGQVLIALNPKTDELRSVDGMIESMRSDIESTAGPDKISFLRLAGGPPTSKPILVKVRGDDTEIIRQAVKDLKQIMKLDPAIRDITDDDSQGQMELALRVNQDAARRAGISPAEVTRTLRLLVDGEIVSKMQDQGEELEIRVRALPRTLSTITEPGNFTLSLPNGGRIALKELVHSETGPSINSIRHYNFRRTITVEADLDKTLTDTVTANKAIQDGWGKIAQRYPSINLDFSGELDDIQESIDSIAVLFLFGIGLMYLILGTQFKSYFQPLMILATVPMAFTGVVIGLAITSNPLSLFTLYGVVALAGIAVNAAIVLISAANERLNRGMSVLHATLYAARRRVIPILITSMTTIAGLFSLATGLGGSSLMWGPVATAIVWGLAVSTVLTLFVIPLLYRLFMGNRWVSEQRIRANQRHQSKLQAAPENRI